MLRTEAWPAPFSITVATEAEVGGREGSEGWSVKSQICCLYSYSQRETPKGDRKYQMLSYFLCQMLHSPWLNITIKSLFKILLCVLYVDFVHVSGVL